MVKHVAVAGTFDHFHAGHRYLLQEVFSNAETVSLAITDDKMTEGKILASQIESFAQRKKTVITYLEEENWYKRTKISTLSDIYGVAVEDETIDAIYVTPDTVSNAEKINKIRTEKNMKPLGIISVPLLESEDNEAISSSRIRLGVIDRNGKSYLKPFLDKDVFTASTLVRDELRSPIGAVVEGPKENPDEAAKAVIKQLKSDKAVLIVTVGDIVTQALQKEKHEPHISFIDNRSRRETLDVIHTAAQKEGPFKNEAGTIQSNIIRAYAGTVQETVYSKEHTQFIIEGEEDLLGLPAIILAPPGSVVLYGQYDAGIVYVLVTDEVKLFCYEMLMRFL
jgi:pantetheine-phosphate adenylyltransferase